MTPEKINIAETSFSATLTDSNKTVFKASDPIDIGGGYQIIPIRPAYSTYYSNETTKKSKIVLHFTVGSIKGDIATLSKKDNKVSVSYVVDRQGNIYNLFDDTKWSYHLGSACIGGNTDMSKASIGIEISNFGPLKLDGGKYIDAYGNLYTTLPEMVDAIDYRGYKYYAKMTDIQIDAIAYLLQYLCKKHGIPDTFKPDTGTPFATAVLAKAFNGIICHTDVRKDKFDFPPEQTRQIIDRFNAIFHPAPAPKLEHKVEPIPEPVPDEVKQPETSIETIADTPATLAPSPKAIEDTKNSSIIDIIIKLILALIGKR